MAEEHKHGEMDITVQEETFAGFMKWTIRGTIIICLFGIPLMLAVA